LLRYLSVKVSGLVAPWLYIGMLFSAFCWHNEDNYLYSINYMHWGATKTWYGVPGDKAEEFEAVMRAAMPELFSYSPDLLYHITTMLSPRRLLEKGVPCYKINQECGEYILTFPQAYHGGFSHGFNCCEAVNFATADWVPYGLAATARYRQFKHIAAFSVAKLLCTIAEAPLKDKLQDGDLHLLAKHMRELVDEEQRLRDDVTKDGLNMKLSMEHAPASTDEDGDDDDGRLCSLCKQSCYLAFVACPATEDKSYCLRHCRKMGDLSRGIMYTRYDDDELQALASKLQAEADANGEPSPAEVASQCGTSAGVPEHDGEGGIFG
jgi:histone demethylase JARID1